MSIEVFFQPGKHLGVVCGEASSNIRLGVQVAEAGSALHGKAGKMLAASWLLLVLHLSLPGCCSLLLWRFIDSKTHRMV